MGEWTGNVRSTPTPKLTLRTVKVSRAPVPWRRITGPWNTWTRSRLPSTTLTCTLTVSPGRKSGMSSRRLSRSTMSVGFMARVLGGGDRAARVPRHQGGGAGGKPSPTRSRSLPGYPAPGWGRTSAFGRLRPVGAQLVEEPNLLLAEPTSVHDQVGTALDGALQRHG